MRKTRFSDEMKKTFSLALDLARDEAEVSGGVTKADLENKLRNTFNEELLGGLTLFQAWRRNKLDVYELVEEIVTTAIADDVLNTPFINEFVEVKNRAFGDTSQFYSNGGYLEVASFAGNHWDTNRQKMPIGTAYTLPHEWAYVHVYEEFERFLLSLTDLTKMTDRVYKSTNKFIQDRIYTIFTTLESVVDPAFTANANSEEGVGNVVDLVQAAGGYNDIVIAGTRSSLRKLTGMIPANAFADSQKEAKAATGSIGVWEGCKLFVIPQVLVPGTFTTKLPNNKLFILGGDVKPVKLEYIGDTRTIEDTTGTIAADATVGLQVQTCFGVGLEASEYFGVVTLQ